MYVEGMGQKSGPCTATFNDLLCFYNVLSVSCYQGDCQMCLGTRNLIGNTEQKSEDSNIDNITYSD
jgi:hypothetical protein